jgi:hypothetical protein
MGPYINYPTLRKAWHAFMDDVAKLNIRFPVASIAQRTASDKAEVKRYVEGRKMPGRHFLIWFYAAFRHELAEAGIQRDIQQILDEPAILRAKFSDELRLLAERQIALADVQLSIIEQQRDTCSKMKEVVTKMSCL